jgi:hypothetical protein
MRMGSNRISLGALGHPFCRWGCDVEPSIG